MGIEIAEILFLFVWLSGNGIYRQMIEHEFHAVFNQPPFEQHLMNS